MLPLLLLTASHTQAYWCVIHPNWSTIQISHLFRKIPFYLGNFSNSSAIHLYWTNLLASLFRTISSAALILGPWVSKPIPKFNNVVFCSKELTIFCSTWLPIMAHYKRRENNFNTKQGVALMWVTVVSTVGSWFKHWFGWKACVLGLIMPVPVLQCTCVLSKSKELQILSVTLKCYRNLDN